MRLFQLLYHCVDVFRARVQLEVATHPRLVKHLQSPILTVLEEALSSHRYALSLDVDNADTLFNASQVLTTMAEQLANDDYVASETQILGLLEEALDLQSRCLRLQELKFEESEAQRKLMEEQIETRQNAEPPDLEEDGNVADDQWFSVITPVTKDTLLDTALAQLGTLTTLCSTISSIHPPPTSPSLAWIERSSTELLNSKIAEFASLAGSERRQEIALAKANFLSNILEMGFSQGQIDIDTYKRERDTAFQADDLKLEAFPEGLIANGQSLMSFASSMLDAPLENGAILPSSRWNALSAAITNFATASKLQQIDPNDQAKTHFLRGDCSLLLFQLSSPPFSYDSAIKNASQLQKNAEVFYRNASKLGDDIDQKLVASLRSSVAQKINASQDPETLAASLGYLGKPREWIQNQFEDMIDDGLLQSDSAG